MKTIFLALCVALVGGCVEDGRRVPEPAPCPDAGLPHEDGQCFALSSSVYPTHYAWCKQQYGAGHELPFACDVPPPEDVCAPLYDGVATYPDRFCCCDPSADPACDFYKTSAQ